MATKLEYKNLNSIVDRQLEVLAQLMAPGGHYDQKASAGLELAAELGTVSKYYVMGQTFYVVPSLACSFLVWFEGQVKHSKEFVCPVEAYLWGFLNLGK